MNGSLIVNGTAYGFICTAVGNVTSHDTWYRYFFTNLQWQNMPPANDLHGDVTLTINGSPQDRSTRAMIGPDYIQLAKS